MLRKHKKKNSRQLLFCLAINVTLTPWYVVASLSSTFADDQKEIPDIQSSFSRKLRGLTNPTLSIFVLMFSSVTKQGCLSLVYKQWVLSSTVCKPHPSRDVLVK